MKKIGNEYADSTFENIKHIDEYGIEYWFARDLQKVLEYKDWRNFKKVIDKAVISAKNSVSTKEDWVVEVDKPIKTGKGKEEIIKDYKLSRYICYLIVQNADPSKEVVALGQTYFAVQIRKQEITEQEYDSLSDDEKRFYQKITNIYSSCSVDYDKDSEITKTFFKTVQNKLTFSVTGNTPTEIIYNRVDADKDNMGLTDWASSPDGPIYKYDVDIAKNYLTEKKLKNLNKIVTMYLDYAELKAENYKAMTMKDWVEKLDVFLQFNGQEILHNAYKVAQELAYRGYDKFKKKQDKLFISDFDKFIEDIKLLEKLERC